MYAKCALTILLAIMIESTHSVIADKGKFESVKPSPIDELSEEKRSVNFKERSEETNNKRHSSETLESEKTKDSRQEKKTRTILPGPLSTDSADKLHCCGSRYEPNSPGRPESGQGIRTASETGRYPSRYGSRPEERFGWQSYNPGSPGRRGSIGSSSGPGPGSQSGSQTGGGLYGGSYSGGDRYGTRPSYYGGDSDYDRPSHSGNRPGRPSYGYGGNSYADNGAYGSNGYEVSRPGGTYGNRPPGGIHFGGGRPGSGIYGGGHGVYGTIGEEGEFPGQEDGPEPGHPHPGVSNLNTQKAVALKALAGVALIGAAAALATNPVLLPIGVLAGRRKRSVNSSSQIDEIDIYNLMKLLEDQVPEIYRGKIKEEVLGSPTCVARLACEMQHDYSTDRKNNDTQDNKSVANVYESLKKHLVNLIQRKVLNAGIRYKNIKKLIKSADVYEGKCNVFVCDFMKN